MAKRKKKRLRVSLKRVLSEVAADANAAPTARILAARSLQRMNGAKLPSRSGVECDKLLIRALALLAEDGWNDPDRLETAGAHRGVPLHRGQDETRLDIVRRDIDLALAMREPQALAAFAEDDGKAPESRLIAARLCQVCVEAATGLAASRPVIDLGRVIASTAGLNCDRWQSATHFASMLQPRWNAVARPVAIDD